MFLPIRDSLPRANPPGERAPRRDRELARRGLRRQRPAAAAAPDRARTRPALARATRRQAS